MVHQDENGVLFQALNKQTGHLVALQRFFVEDEVLAHLKEFGEDGKTIFEQWLEGLRRLEVPHLQKVLGGGFDELDGTPYLVAEWNDGLSLAEGHEKKVFSAGEGEAFREHARASLMALPAEAQAAVCLQEDEILVNRDQSGALLPTFQLSPLRYFGAAGGMRFENEDWEEAIVQLAERFPPASEAPVSALMVGSAPLGSSTPMLASAQKSTSKGPLWGSLAAVLVLGGIAGWFFLIQVPKQNSLQAEGADQVVDAETVAASEKVSAAGENPEQSRESDELASSTLEATEEDGRQGRQEEKLFGEEIAEQKMPRAEQEPVAEERPVARAPARQSLLVVEEKPLEGEVDLFGDDEEKDEEEEEGAVALSKGAFSPDNLAGIEAINGEKILLEGTVVSCTESGSGKTWYFEFGERRTQAMVSFVQSQSPVPVEKEDWLAFEGKEVAVSGRVKVNKGGFTRGSGVMIEIQGMEDVKLKSGADQKPSERLYQFADLDVLRSIPIGEMIVFEGAFKNFKANAGKVYLYFEDGYSVVGRVDVGEASFNRALAKKLEGLKGSRIRITGQREEEENAQIEIAIQVAGLAGVLAAP